MGSFHFTIAESNKEGIDLRLNQDTSYALWQTCNSWNGLLTIQKWEKYHATKNTQFSESSRTLGIQLSYWR